VQLGAAISEFRSPQEHELELAGDQHLQDRRQCVLRDPDVSVDPVQAGLERAQGDGLVVLALHLTHVERRQQRHLDLVGLHSFGLQQPAADL
jgi:hypothetical protein